MPNIDMSADKVEKENVAVNQNYEEGYIDKNNNIIVPFGKFKDCFDFHCGVARVRIDDSEITYIDKKGEC